MSLSPKRLPLNKMWELYLILEPSLDTSDQDYMVDTVLSMLDRMVPQSFSASLKLLYGKIPEKKTPVEWAVFFIRGLKKNNFFEFDFQMRKLNHGRTIRG